MKNIIDDLEELIYLSREIYKSIKNPLYKLEKKELIETLTNLKTDLEVFTKKILNINKYTIIQYSSEINSNKLDLFYQDFLQITNKINTQIFLETNKKEIDHKLINIKEAITKPQTFYDIEEELKNEVSLFINHIEESKTKIQHKYTNITTQKKSIEELLKIAYEKEEKIKELTKKVQDFKWLEAKEKAKESLISNLERELIKQIKINEKNSTIINMHLIKIENEITEMYRNIRKINLEVKEVEKSNFEKEKIALELIKELKDELLTTRYALLKTKDKVC
jgi:hypothetical protein